MAWIHDRPEWPRFTWDDAARTSALAGVRHLQGRHLGRVEALEFDVRAETNVAALTDEVVRSSAIEGEHLNSGEVRSSIADLALAQADGTKERFYSMSKGIAARRTEYYRQLEAAQRSGPDITAWLLWFLSCLDQTIRDAGTQLGAALEKAQLRQRINRHPLNERQRKIIDRLLDNFQGHLTTSKYAKLANCSNDTTLRDIRDLLARAIIVRNAGGGRSTSYRLEVSPL